MTQTTSKPLKAITCSRCAGRGSFDHFGHIRDGICFKCEGAGIVTPERREVLAGERAATIARNKNRKANEEAAAAALAAGPVEHRNNRGVERTLEDYFDRVRNFDGTKPAGSRVQWDALCDAYNLPRLSPAV